MDLQVNLSNSDPCHAGIVVGGGGGGGLGRASGICQMSGMFAASQNSTGPRCVVWRPDEPAAVTANAAPGGGDDDGGARPEHPGRTPDCGGSTFSSVATEAAAATAARGKTGPDPAGAGIRRPNLARKTTVGVPHDLKIAAGEAEAVAVEREAVASEREAVAAELEAVAAEQHAVAVELEAVAVKRQAIAAERQAVAAKREAVAAVAGGGGRSSRGTVPPDIAERFSSAAVAPSSSTVAGLDGAGKELATVLEVGILGTWFRFLRRAYVHHVEINGLPMM